ncbi:MAG TPA: amidohydrolase family protein [Xanthobacteraceae bacterium]|nr:amidohydrolase family protein [Xanthobacteraceae bacterium]
MGDVIGRRTFLTGAGVVALAAAGALDAQRSGAQESGAIPNSSGTAAAKLKAPAQACDCHHHIYDAARFPPKNADATIIPDARVPEFRLLQRRIGTSRNIVVTPAAYAGDNNVTLDALAQFGRNARGVAVVGAAISDAELKALDAGGVRGIRFSLAPSDVARMATIEPLAKRIDALGWHVQINMTADQIAAAEDLWNRLPTPIVFDHMGHIPQPAGTAHPTYRIIRALIDKGRTWVKLSVTYDSSKLGPPTYADVNMVGRSYVQAAPERVVWGSNWPHPNEKAKPDDAALFDLVSDWAPSEAARHRLLVDNPATLYGFDKA